MIRKILALLVLLVPFAADAETCTANSAATAAMTAIGTAGIWSGCTPDATDDFVVSNAASEVVLAGTFTMNSLACSAGRVVLAPDLRLTMTGPITVTGTCEMEGIGRVLYDGRPTDWAFSATNNAQTVTFSADLQTTSDLAAGDFIVVGDDDPNGLTEHVNGYIQIGPGDPVGYAVHRPSPAKWKWWRVLSVAGGVVTFEYDQYTGSLAGSYAAGTYQGSRLPIVGITPSANARRKYGTESLLTIPTGTLARSGDLGSRWIEWDAGTCAGQIAKITHTVDGGAGSDLVYYAGDGEHCGTSNVSFTPGARAGDRVRLIRAPIIDFGHDTDGYFAWDFATASVKLQYVKIMRMEYTATSAWGANANDFCSFCIYNSTGTGSSASGFLEDVEIAFTTCNTASDTSVLGIMGVGAAGAPTGGERPRASNIRFERIYIHDQVSEGVSAVGCHGLLDRDSGYAKRQRIRTERIDDDHFGFVGTALTGDSTQYWTEWYQMVSLEQLPDQAVSESHSNITVPVTYASLVQGRGHKLVGHFAFGGSSRIHDNVVLGSTFADMVTGGADGSAVTNGGENVFFSTGSATRPTGWPDYASGADPYAQYPNLISNSIFFSHGDSATATMRLGGELRDSLVFSGITNTVQLLQFSHLTRSLVDFGDAAEFFSHPTDPSPVAEVQRFTDSVLIGSVAGSLFNASYDNAATFELDDLYLTRVYLAMGSPTAGNGVAANGLNGDDSSGISNTAGTTQTLTVDGLIISAITPTAGALGPASGTPTNSGARVANACSDTTAAATATTVYGASRTSTAHAVLGVGVHSDDDVQLRAFRDPNRSASCITPRDYGVAGISVSAAMLGDLVNAQWNRWTTRDLVVPVGGGSGEGRSW